MQAKASRPGPRPGLPGQGLAPPPPFFSYEKKMGRGQGIQKN